MSRTRKGLKKGSKRRRRRSKKAAAAPKRRRRRSRKAKVASNPRRRKNARRRKHNPKRSYKRRHNPKYRRNARRRRHNPIRSRRRRNPGLGGKLGGIFKGDNVLGLGHGGMDLAGLVVGGLAYGLVSGAAVKYLGFIVNPIQNVLGKGGAKVSAIFGPAIPALLIGIPLNILARRKVKALVPFTRGLLTAAVVGMGAKAGQTLMGGTVAGIPQLRGYDFTPGSMAGGSSFVSGYLEGKSSADFGSYPSEQVTAADFGGMGRYIAAQEAEAMGGYDARGDFGGLGASDTEEGSLG